MICLYYCREGDNIELKYSLRSMEEFLNMPTLIVGGKPDWCHPDFFLPHKTAFAKCEDARAHIANGLTWLKLHKSQVEQVAEQKHAKMLKIRSVNPKNKGLCSSRLLLGNVCSAGADEASDFKIDPVDDVCIMMDDIYLAAPFTVNHSKGTLEGCWQASVKLYGKTAYNEIIKNTMEFLKQMGYPNPINYDSHTPFFCNGQRVLDIFKLMSHTNKPLAFRSVYGNVYKTPHVKAQDIKFRGEEKVKLYSVMSSTDLELTQVLPVLMARFPHQSRHEFNL